MTIQEIHRQVRIKTHQVSNSTYRKLSDYVIDIAINKAIFDYVNKYYYDNGNEKKRIEMFDSLVEHKSLPVTFVSKKNNIKEFELTLDNVEAIESIKLCETCDTSAVDIVLWSNLFSVLNDYHRKPSNRFNQSVATLYQNKLKIFTTRDLKQIEILYLRKPKQVSLGTYPNDSPLPIINTDLPEFYHHLLVEMAVMEIQKMYGKPEIQLTDKNIKEITQ